MEKESMWTSKIEEKEVISLSENSFLEVKSSESEEDYNEKLFNANHSSIKDWNSVCWICRYCNEVFNEFAALKAHEESFHHIFTWGDTYLECFDCKEVLLGYSLFLNHIRGCHYESLKLCCDVCNEVLPDYGQLSTHRDMHNEIGNQAHPIVYHCTLCEVVHSTEKLLKTHMKESHMYSYEFNENKLLNYVRVDEERYENEEDGSATIESIKCEDEFGETEEIFRCGKCVKSFSFETALQRHMQNAHSNEEPFKCDICSKEFQWISVLEVHMRIHNSSSPFKCEICLKEFKLLSSLKRHMQIHNSERSFKCEMCLKEFKRKWNYQVHMRIHNNGPPFKCEFCVEEFNSISLFKNHIKTHTNASFWKCVICSKEFPWNTSLKRHMRTHTNEKPFKCYICSRGFALKVNLKAHMATHTIARPFKCHICSKDFKLKQHLKKHMVKGFHNESFNCGTCFKEFTEESHLKFHRELCNKISPIH